MKKYIFILLISIISVSVKAQLQTDGFEASGTLNENANDEGRCNKGKSRLCGEPITYEGQQYNTVQIGSQCWLADNLNVGTRINGSQNQTNNGSIEKYCYDNLESNCDVYGGLYQWEELMQYTTAEGAQGICPSGWHIPSNDEMCTMLTFLDPTVNCSNTYSHIGTDIGGKMKETGYEHWNTPNTGATNESGFNALGTGYRDVNNTFWNINIYTHFFTSTLINTCVYVHRLDYNTQDVFYQCVSTYDVSFPSGNPVRCIMGESVIGVNSDFSANPIEGIAPLTVQFTDESTGSPSVWIWDFQNDGINDAFIQHPTFTYDEPGLYSVKLIVINSTETDTLVKAYYISVNQASNEDSLVAYYPFNGNAVDETGNGHDGTVYGGASLTNDRFGNENSAYSFDGTSGYIETANSTSLNFPQYSVSLWINFTQPHTGNVFSKHVAGVNGGFSVSISGTKIRFYAPGGVGEMTTTADYNDGSWHHVAGIFRGECVFLYIDNYLDISTFATGYVSSTASVLIGQTGGYFYNGKADDIWFYNKALTADEIFELYNANQVLTPEICIVSVTPDEHNQVIWEKQPTDQISNYYVYRETTQTNVYEVIGSVAYEDSSLFVDMTSNPNQRPYKYKISAFSTSGSETTLSNYHRTIHLTINQGPTGWNLIWSPYEGFPFSTYYIYRGNYPNSLTLLDSISGSFTSYTDINPPWGPLYYAVEIVNEEGCNPSRSGEYDRSRSNVQFNGVVGVEDNFESGIKIYPNPAHDVLNISFEGKFRNLNAEVVISDIQGKIVISQLLQKEQSKINIDALKPGIYIVRVRYMQLLITKKLIVF